MEQVHDFSRVKIKTDYPIASDSIDHLVPCGTRMDNSKNPHFNQKLYRLYDLQKRNRILKVLDVGCSGGGFVKTCIDDGCFGVGLEGSDYSKKMSRAEWPLLGDKFLFTADVTKKLEILQELKNDQIKAILFDVITCWEVMEHIDEKDLPTLCENFSNHLTDDGVLIMSISYKEADIEEVSFHSTVHGKQWWVDYFAKQGLFQVEKIEKFFNTQYIRGPKQGASESFHLIVSKNPDKVIEPPKLSLKGWLRDRWIGSNAHKRILYYFGLKSY